MAKWLKEAKICLGSCFLPSRWKNRHSSRIVLWRIFIWRWSRGQVSPAKITPKNLPSTAGPLLNSSTTPQNSTMTWDTDVQNMVVWGILYINNRTGALTIPIGPRRVSSKQVSHMHKVLHSRPVWQGIFQLSRTVHTALKGQNLSSASLWCLLWPQCQGQEAIHSLRWKVLLPEEGAQ